MLIVLTSFLPQLLSDPPTPTSLHPQLCVQFFFQFLESICVTHILLDVEASTGGAWATFLGATPSKTNPPSPVHSSSGRVAGSILPTSCWSADWLVLVQVLPRHP